MQNGLRLLISLSIVYVAGSVCAQTVGPRIITVTPVTGPPVTISSTTPIQVQPVIGSEALRINQMPQLAIKQITITEKEKTYQVTVDQDGKMQVNGQATSNVIIDPNKPIEVPSPTPVEHSKVNSESVNQQSTELGKSANPNIVATGTPTPEPKQADGDGDDSDGDSDQDPDRVRWWLAVFGALCFGIGTIGVLASERPRAWVIVQVIGVSVLVVVSLVP